MREVVKNCRELGIQVLTLYAFSVENWNRPKTEINALMRLLKHYVRSEIEELHRNNIRINGIGNLQNLPEGMYILRVRNDNVVMTKRIVIAR